MRNWNLVVLTILLSAVASASTSDIVRQQRERELSMVQHLRRHVADPGDGLALAADRRDLQRLRTGVPTGPVGSLSYSATDDELLDALSAVLDIWYTRIVDRTPFGLMPRERLNAIARAQQALGQLQSRGRAGAEDRFVPEMQQELALLSRFAGGQGEVSEQSIDYALRLADTATSGRPMIGPGPYPLGPGPYPPGAGPGASTMPPLPPSPGPYDRGGPPPAPVPPGGGPTPYSLPPGYGDYAPGAAASAGGIAACQTLRNAAGAAGAVVDMLRAAECWTRTPTWPGWGTQALESLDWAATFARASRDCHGLGTAIDSLRQLGPRIAVSGLTYEVTRLAERAESDRRWLRGRNQCTP